MWLLVTCLAVLGGILLLEGLLWLAFKALPFLNVEEFPEVTEESLRKFTTFDPELGWAPQPDTSKLDRESMIHARYSLDALGRRTMACRPNGPVEISSYGNSFCFCREVGDDETWQSYLGEMLGADVSNYGAGNYGLDQALLRLKRQHEVHPTDCVVIAITPWTIMRILSVWKHYSEFGNTWACKPRYAIQNGKFVLLECCINDKLDLMRMSYFADFLHAHDFHYRNFFLKHQPRFPRTLYLLRDRLMSHKIFFSVLLGVAYYGRLKPLINFFHYRRSQHELRYKQRLFRTQTAMFRAVVGEFVSFAAEKGFRPVLMMVPGYEDLLFMRRHGNYYGAALREVAETFPELMVIDMHEQIRKAGAPASLFTKSRYGWPGHYNARGNRLIAEGLASKLRPQLQPQTEGPQTRGNRGTA